MFYKVFEARISLRVITINYAQTEIKWLCLEAKKVFMSQPVYLELISPLYVGGIIISYTSSKNENEFKYIFYL